MPTKPAGQQRPRQSIEPVPRPPSDIIITKNELARELRLCTRSVDRMVEQGKIPFIRATKRSIRFHLPRVLDALAKLETKEAA